MAGRQGHNARKGKQGFQETYDGPPELVDLPEYADEAEPTAVDETLDKVDGFFDRMAKEMIPNQTAAHAIAVWTAGTAIMGAGVFGYYLPAGGNVFIGWSAGIFAIAVTSFFMLTMIADTKRWGKNRDK